jgi:signal transduction histidine kinase
MKKELKIVKNIFSEISLASFSLLKTILNDTFKNKDFLIYLFKKNTIFTDNLHENKKFYLVNNLVNRELHALIRSYKSTEFLNYFPIKYQDSYLLIFTIKHKKYLIIEIKSSDENEIINTVQNKTNIIENIFHILKLEQNQKKILKYKRKITKYKIKNRTKQIKASKHYDNLKSSFLANLSHEINTPMNSIIGFTELLQIPNLQTDKVIKFANIANKNAKRLLTYIENIIDLSKIESKTLLLKNETIIINNLLNEIYILNNNKVLKEKGKNISFVLNIPAELKKVQINADPLKIKQVLSILLSNAINFTETGSIELGVKKIDNNQIQFYVKDTGCGIKKEKEQDIFYSFSQGGDFLKRKHEGGGLGLSIAKGILSFYNSKIEFQSFENKGSTFYFNFPVLAENIKNVLLG